MDVMIDKDGSETLPVYRFGIVVSILSGCFDYFLACSLFYAVLAGS